MVKELEDPRVHGFGISADGISMLHDAAHAFRNLEDSARLLAKAAQRLKTLPDDATRLVDAAGQLTNLEGNARVPSLASQKLLTAAPSLNGIPDNAKIISRAADKAMRAAQAMGDRRFARRVAHPVVAKRYKAGTSSASEAGTGVEGLAPLLFRRCARGVAHLVLAG
ncbi:hypothetical protein ACFXPZ_38820 [Streptomyces sp. NPDC059101]|uniref:hypothetical protein n=1 Tax=unclassified Streptomyces TaxID=2593676 RepID=UPI00367F1730